MENRGALAASSRPLQRLLAALMAVVLVFGLAPHAAWADEAKSGNTVDVSLTLVQGMNYNGPIAKLNKHYELHKGATLKDLFEAAKSAGDIKDYAFKDSGYGSYIDSVTLSDGAVLGNKSDWSSSWSNFKNGEYASGSACQEGDKVKSNDAFQFAYCDAVANYAPTTDQWSALVGKSTQLPAAIAAKYDAAKAQSLIDNLSARFAAGGKDASISNATVDAAIALNAMGQGASIDVDAIKANLENYEAVRGYPITAGALGKYIMALTAAGVDCTKVTLSDGNVHNLVSEMEEKADASTLDLYSAVYILPVYKYGSYAVGTKASMGEGDLVDFVLSKANSEGLFDGGYGADTQTSAQAILALQPYASSNATVKSAIEKAGKALLSYQNEDGGFAYSFAFTSSNLDATAAVVCALTALGYDCAEGKDLVMSNGSSPLGYLEAMADSDLSGYLTNSSYNESQTSATVLAAFVAHANQRAAYNVYTLNKVERLDANSQQQTGTGNTDNGSTATDAKALAQTGDSSAATALMLAALAGAAGIAVARRRMPATIEVPSDDCETRLVK